MNSSSPSCETVKLVSMVLNGASERAVLIADDGTVLHMNSAADHFLYAPTTDTVHVTDFLVLPTEDHGENITTTTTNNNMDWLSIQHSRIVMKNQSQTRTERNIHWSQLPPCGCCQNQYYTAFICSKHERVREVVDRALDPVLTINEEGIICTSNDAATTLFGYSESELVGHSIGMLCGEGHGEHHDQYMKNYMETGIKKFIGTTRELRARKKCGTEFPCQLGVQEITDVSSGKRYFCGFMKDLTALRQHEAELEQGRALAQGMINASFDPMLQIDETGVIQVVNDAACMMFGYSREEFLGSSIAIICGQGHAEKHASYMQRYLTTGEKHIIGRKRQVPARRKDGSEIDVELGVQEIALSTTGKKAFCGYIRDLTERKKDKRALRKQAKMIHNKFFGEQNGDEGQE